MQQQEQFLKSKLAKRKVVGTFRDLQVAEGNVDFWSNDYLGFSRSKELQANIHTAAKELANGATGSRLISGNSTFTEQLEQQIATYHDAESALLFNSGYDANVGLFSCIAAAGDTIFYDELVHASIHDGLRLSRAKTVAFQHNNVQDLAEKLATTTGNSFIAIESVYSMDGDIAPLLEFVELAEKYDAAILIDEAHGTGILGKKGDGLVNALGLEKRIFARIHTYGKAMGVHGATVLGSHTLRDYLMNYARSFIFTTALPPHSLVAIQQAYFWLENHPNLRQQLDHNIAYFIEKARPLFGAQLLKSKTAIQGIIIPDNDAAKAIAKTAQVAGYQVKAIVFPTVAKGEERIRICIHAFNTEVEIDGILSAIHKAILTQNKRLHIQLH